MYYDNDEFFIHKNSMPKEVDEALSTLYLSDNNIDGKIAHLRDTFLAAEREYVLELLKDETVREMIRDVNWYSSYEIVKTAEQIVFEVENNLIQSEKMNETEMTLTILLAAIQDKVLVKVLEKYYEPKQENSNGRSR